MLEPLFWTVVILWLVYKWWTQPYSYWQRRGFPYKPARFPLGSVPDLALLSRFPGDVISDVYHEMGDEPYSGIILVRRPHLVVKDPEVVKAVCQDDFEYFTDRANTDVVKDPIYQSLFNLTGWKWKAVRHRLTPIFSSGKLKTMYNFFLDVSQDMTSHLDSKEASHEVKNLMYNFTTDVVASSVFGLDVSSFKDPNNEFTSTVRLITTTRINLRRKLKYFIDFLLPEFRKYIGFKFIPSKVGMYFSELLFNKFKHRKETGFRRNDFIDLLLDLQAQNELQREQNPNESINITDDILASQVVSFLSTGTDSPSTLISVALYMLAINQDIQDRLRQEITKEKDYLSYEAVKNYPYLNQVIHECLRMHPLVPIFYRKCTRQYRMRDRSDRVLDKETRIIIPVHALHNDPKYFPEPDRFDPERFSPANKAKIPPFVYQPFGLGPRMCIAPRYGMLEVKLALVTVLSKYSVTPSPDTPKGIKFLPSTISVKLDGPLHLTFTPLPDHLSSTQKPVSS